MTELERLLARDAARDLVARYNQNGDHGRVAEMTALFADDAALRVEDDEPVVGRDAIERFFREVREGPRALHLRHFTATHQIDVDAADVAAGRCYFVVLTENGVDHWGEYHDRYRRTGDGWRFAERHVQVDGTTPGGWAEARIGTRPPR